MPKWSHWYLWWPHRLPHYTPPYTRSVSGGGHCTSLHLTPSTFQIYYVGLLTKQMLKCKYMYVIKCTCFCSYEALNCFHYHIWCPFILLPRCTLCLFQWQQSPHWNVKLNALLNATLHSGCNNTIGCCRRVEFFNVLWGPGITWWHWGRVGEGSQMYMMMVEI